MASILNRFASTFMPPFTGLAWVVLIYVLCAHILYPHNDIWRGNLPDPDDYMYLTQVLDWMQGQGWYDNIQHRLDPPQGVPIHFSRVVQIPIAIGIWMLQLLGLKPHGAAMVTALLEPFFLLAICLWVLQRVSSCVVSQRWAGASAYVTFFSIALLFEFMPGHIDHHGLVIIVIMGGLGCILRLMDEPQNIKISFAVGIILSVALMIALECLPWVLLLSGWLGLWSLLHGGKATRSASVFAITFVVSSLACLFITRSLPNLLEMDILTFSVIYVLLSLAMAVPFIGVTIVEILCPPTTREIVRKGWRLLVGLTLATLSGGLFFLRFPELLVGPYGGINPQLVTLLLNESQEARPILEITNGWMHMVTYMGMGFIALFVSVKILWNAHHSEREKWVVITLMLLVAIGLSIFYQYRFVGIESALAVIPLTAFLERGWKWTGKYFRGRNKVLVEIALLFVVGPMLSVIIPSLFDSRSFNTGILLFPVDSWHTPCDTAQLEHILRDPNGLGNQSLLIVNFMDLGPELLFRTDHRVLAAPFHMDIDGNIDAAKFFMTTNPSEARNIAQRRGIDLVVACRAMLHRYVEANSTSPVFAELLFAGTPPKWLERISASELDDFILYRVHPASL